MYPGAQGNILFGGKRFWTDCLYSPLLTEDGQAGWLKEEPPVFEAGECQYPPQLVHYLKTYGQDKVLFGTNFPQLSWENCVQQVQAMNLPEEIELKFLGENARRVFQLD